MSNEAQPSPPVRVGVVGGGQLARMMGEAAREAGVYLVVLASSNDDAALDTCDAHIIGDPRDERALKSLSEEVDVITFDHELVDLEQIKELEERTPTRPGARALAYAVDKAYQRRGMSAAGIAVPRHVVVDAPADPAIVAFLAQVGQAVVVKAARGGYDGRGVIFCDGEDEVNSALADIGARAVIEERLELEGELAQVLVRDVEGHVALYPLVDTVQRDGMCVETRFPAAGGYEHEAAELALRIAEHCGVVGALAVELFITHTGLLVNELAMRPHNTGHWTIEGCRTSQFVNHLRAVSGQGLGSSEPVTPAAVMVNLVGAEAPGSRRAAVAVPGAHVHDYGKTWRSGRKLGHVTVIADDAGAAHARAWESARAYGTSAREA